MATVSSPATGLPTPSSAVSRRPTAPAAPKLRDSCQACAYSKLKCKKEKPTCSRCAKRGIKCEYVATKRGGRTSDSRSSNNGSDHAPARSTARETASNQPPSPLNSWFAPNPTVLATDSLSSLAPGPGRPSVDTTASGAPSSLFPAHLSMVEQSLSFAHTDSIIDLDNSFTSPRSYSLPDLSDIDIPGHSHFLSSGVDSSSNESANLFDTFPMFEDAMSDEIIFSTPRSPPNSRALTSSDAPSFQSSMPLDPSCFCLARALGIMKQLFPTPSTPCSTSATQGLDKHTTIPTIQAVIAKNEHTVESVNTMLQCSCSQDGYLLTIMSLIIFKVLGWYAAAARKPSSPKDSNCNPQENQRTLRLRSWSHSEQVLQDPAIVGSYCLEGKDSARMAMQLVLSELHRVQRLLNQLSAKLELQAAKSGGGGADTPHSLDSIDSGGESTLPLSAGMLNQLQVELRKRLKALSSEILEGLRFS